MVDLSINDLTSRLRLAAVECWPVDKAPKSLTDCQRGAISHSRTPFADSKIQRTAEGVTARRLNRHPALHPGRSKGHPVMGWIGSAATAPSATDSWRRETSH